MPVIGTAGHVDHGKSTLVEGLTGRDPDRWEEEKRRGLTIDLGFAWTTLPSNVEVSFVDVPGHERFLKNMLAGIEAVDIALLVVAVDEGWMPQTEEHVAVLDLLGVRRGVVALTKVDKADCDLVELAQIEIGDRLAGTSLAGVPIVPVSVPEDRGLDLLIDELDKQTRSVKTVDLGRPRLWVDRSFSTAGAGTVVTGTLLEGPVNVEDEIVVYPEGRTGRIRAIQSHETPHQSLQPGRRAALNLAGVERAEVARGSMVGLPEQWVLTDRFSASLRTARYAEELKARGAYQMHVGSGAHRVELLAVEDEGAILRLPEGLPLRSGDRFIIRDTGRRLVVAGGRVLDPHPGPTKVALGRARDIDPDLGAEAVADVLLAQRGHANERVLMAETGGGAPSRGRLIDDTWVADSTFAKLAQDAESIVERHHQAHPLRVGMPLATLAEQLGVPTAVADAVVASRPTLERQGPEVRSRGHIVELPQSVAREWEEVRNRIASDLAVPTIAEMGLDAELVHLLLRNGELVRISPDLAFLPDQIASIKVLIGQMPSEFTVADFRDRAGLSRKYAVPILEWADKEGLTVRRGDVRTAR